MYCVSNTGCSWGADHDRLDTGIVGSNTAESVGVCLRISVLCCFVWIETERRADRSTKESVPHV